jgi:hypothetical protein
VDAELLEFRLEEPARSFGQRAQAALDLREKLPGDTERFAELLLGQASGVPNL